MSSIGHTRIYTSLTDVTRIQALTWIARDMSKTIGHDMTALNSSIAEGRK